MTTGNKAYQAWKESAAGREADKYYQAIRDYDRQQSDKQMEEEDQARAIQSAKRKEIQGANKQLDSILLGVIIGSGIATVLIGALIAYEKLLGL